MAKCLMCGKETYKVLFSKAIVKIYICSLECLKEYHKPIKRFRLRIQTRLKEDEGWLG
ncbi:MAG: hypothetical protein OEX09_01135 [Candidatus Bathyarchaeota archaeon]|nr:hypothetical protein [Candidatus Bathyarchaeota archaeon]